MKDQQLNSHVIDNEEIKLRELFAIVWQGKWIVFPVTFVFTIASIFFALSLPNIYKSEVVLAPVTDNSDMKIPGQLGGLAALAGVNLSKGSDKTSLAIEIIKSRDFVGRFIVNHDLLIPLMAAENWSRTDNSLVINPDIFDVKSKQWIRHVAEPFNAKPSLLEAHEVFMKIFKITKSDDNEMILLSVEHYSPYIAQEWASLLVKDINDEMKMRELKEAQRSIIYLNEQISKTNISDIKTMLFSLIEEQTKTVMLANVREEYMFRTIDPAVVAENKSKPKRAIIVAMGAILGGMLSLMFIFVRHFSRFN